VEASRWVQLKKRTSRVPPYLEPLRKSSSRFDPREPDKAQIDIEAAEDLYGEIRIDNTLKNSKGEEVSLKEGRCDHRSGQERHDQEGKLG
jgi:hypothetical protein